MSGGQIGDGVFNQIVDLTQAGNQEILIAAFGQRGDAGERNIYAIEEGLFFFFGGGHGSETVVGRAYGAGFGNHAAAGLAFLVAETFAGDLDVGHSENRVVGAFGNFNIGRKFAVIVSEPWGSGVILQRRPGVKAGGDLIGEGVGVTGGFENFLGHGAGGLMIAVTIGGAADKDRSDYQRTGHADDTHDVGEDAIVSPLGNGFGFGFGKTVVNHTSPILVHTVVAIGGEQLFRSDETKTVKIIGRHDVGAALAAIQGEQRNPRALTA